MLHKKIAVLAVVLAATVFAPMVSHAAKVVTNTGTASFENEFTDVMTPATSSTPFLVVANPALTVVKTHDVNVKAKSGQVVTYEIRVTYPMVTDALSICGDDSNAVNTVITDAIPTGMTYQAGTIKISTNNGSGFGSAGTDASDAVDASGYDVSFDGTNVIAVLGTIVECTTGASTIVVQFQAKVN